MSAGTKGIMKQKPNGLKKDPNKRNIENKKSSLKDENVASVSTKNHAKPRKSEVSISNDNEYYEDNYDSRDGRGESFYLHGGTDSSSYLNEVQYAQDLYSELNPNPHRLDPDPWSTEEKIPRHIKV